MLFENVLQAVGNTPLIRLNRLSEEGAADIYVKFEAVNVGGSIKTRTAYNMVKEAIAAGKIGENTIICEPTSGNQGVGLALVGAVMGIPVRIVMPDSVSEERRKLIRHYGAEVVLVHDEGDIGKCIDDCLNTALRMAAEDPNVFVPQQFVNPANPAAHRDGTAAEILRDAPGTIDGFCAGIGTGGTLTGVGEALRAVNPETVIWAVEPENAAILTGGPITTHMQMGIGDGLIPENLNTKLINDVFVVSDADAIAVARRLAREEGLLCGISSGSNVAAAMELARRLGPGKRVVTLLPDTAERYFSTPLFD